MTAATRVAARPAPAGPVRARNWARRFERLALVYLLAISAGVFGFLDVLAFGEAYDKASESLFARALWPLAYLAFTLLLVWHRRAVCRAALAAWWLLPLPLLAGLSCLWSIEPTDTLNGTIRFAMTTAIGLYLGVRFNLLGLARALFCVLMFGVGGSLAATVGGFDFAFMDDGAIRGLFHHKNVLGGLAAMLIATAAALTFGGWRPGLALIGGLVGMVAALLSSSAGGLGVAGTIIVLAPIALALRGHSLTLVWRLAVLAALATLLGFVLVITGFDPVSTFLDAVNREATLTGRFLLWQAALHHISAHPALGVGFDAFWDAGLDWRTLLVLDQLGYVLHFHNSFLELGVQLGAGGLIAGGMMLAGYGRAALLALHRDDLPLWPVLTGVVILALAMIEFVIFRQHALFHVLLVAIPVAVLARHDAAPAGADPQLRRP